MMLADEIHSSSRGPEQSNDGLIKYVDDIRQSSVG